jgi:16S rRNA (guanine527-N7)-methyltransferase
VDNLVDTPSRRSYGPHPHWGSRRRVTWVERGTGKPGHEPNEPGKTEPPTDGAKHDDVGSGSHRRYRARPQEGCLSRQREPLPTRVLGLPALPAAYHEALDAGLRAIALELDAGRRSSIDDHVRLLLAWNAAINLTAIRDPAAIATRHVLDSLAAVEVLRERGVRGFIDIGSGAGYPGIPLLVALPAERALLVESVGKKAAFLAAAIDALDLGDRAAVASTRAESLATDPAHRGRWPAVVARAVAGLADLVELSLPLLRPGGLLVAWKGGAVDDELAAAGRAARQLGGGRPEVVDLAVPGADRHRLVIVSRRGPVPAGYPRDPATRRRRPW